MSGSMGTMKITGGAVERLTFDPVLVATGLGLIVGAARWIRRVLTAEVSEGPSPATHTALVALVTLALVGVTVLAAGLVAYR
jgi:hypothetical protein